MDIEQTPSEPKEPEFKDYYVTEIADIAPIAGIKRWLEKRHNNRRRELEDSEMTETRLHSDHTGSGDRFYYGPDNSFNPEPLGIFAAEPVASALSYARQLEQDNKLTDRADG